MNFQAYSSTYLLLLGRFMTKSGLIDIVEDYPTPTVHQCHTTSASICGRMGKVMTQSSDIPKIISFSISCCMKWEAAESVKKTHASRGWDGKLEILQLLNNGDSTISLKI